MEIRRPTGISPVNDEAARESIEETPLLDSQNPAMIALLETVRRAATADTTILLNGESGTGKDVLARQIHRWSPRRDGPFVVISCTTLAEHLLENELFGHVRGAFTGAVNDKPGRLEAGHGGTVLFDEIAELPTALQAKLLRFIQERRFERVGSDLTIRVDVRLLAASNRNLEAEVRRRTFSRGSVLSAQRDLVHTSAAPRTYSGHPSIGALAIAADLNQNRQQPIDTDPKGGRSDDRLRMARQHPRA
jgi:transcriptional regulator with PAS, ATPase and Fis domain